MKCNEVRRKLKAWIDGEIDERAATRVKQHVGECAACQEVARDFRILGRLLRQAPAAAAPPAKLAEIGRRAKQARRETETIIRLAQRVAAMAAAILILCSLFWIFLLVEQDSRQLLSVSPPKVENVRGDGGAGAEVDADEALAVFLTNLDAWPMMAAVGE